MSTEDNIAIAAVRREFTNALAEVLAENAAVCPVRRGRVARAHAAIKRHPGYNEHEFCAAVEFAFEQWETLQNAVRRRRLSHAHKSRGEGGLRPTWRSWRSCCASPECALSYQQIAA